MKDGELRIYDKNRCVFREGDPPDRYYMCLFGVVSVHKFSGDDDRSKFGRKLVELRDGAGFGEVAFSESCPNRNASVVAVGDEDLATVAETSAPGLSAKRSVSWRRREPSPVFMRNEISCLTRRSLCSEGHPYTDTGAWKIYIN